MTDDELLIAAERELGLRGSLYDFVKMAWPIVEPSVQFIDNWHIEEICNHLQAVSEGRCLRLIINVPPGCSKSLLTSVLWPAWEWIQRKGTRFICASFDATLTLRDGRRMLALVNSSWFRARWGLMCANKAPAGEFANNGGGWRFNTSVDGKMTGRHCDIMIVDDPLKPKDVSKTTLEGCKRWWKETVPTRFGNQSTGRKVIIMQRLHEADLVGVAMEEGGWTVLRLPMRYEASFPCVTPFGGDRRTEDGSLLDAVRFPEARVKVMEVVEMGSRVAAAQLQQRPVPEAGQIFKREWFKFYKELPARFDSMVQSWDCTFKDTDGSDYVCGGTWGIRGAEYYLLPGYVHERLDFPSTLSAVESQSRAHPKALTKLIEDKANGPAVISMLKKKLPGIIAIEPEGGKEARANAVSPMFEAGNVFFPDPSIEPRIDDLITEMTSFPFAAHDDRVDMITQFLNYIHSKVTSYGAAMANAKKMFGL